MALFISFEGGEGSGKTTQAERLSNALTRVGVSILEVHEPGHTELGDHIRQLIKGRPWGGVTVSPTAELFLFAASRAELVSKALTERARDPRLVIIADRYADSTTAYQGYGRRLPLDLVESVNRLATGGLMPHKTFLLDCPPKRGLERVEVQTRLFDMNLAGRADQDGARRFEDEPLNFHERVRRGYLKLAKQEPDRWEIIDALADPDEVFQSIWNSLERMDEFERVLSQLQDAPDLFGLHAYGS